MLDTIEGESDSDYVNASYVDVSMSWYSVISINLKSSGRIPSRGSRTWSNNSIGSCLLSRGKDGNPSANLNSRLLRQRLHKLIIRGRLRRLLIMRRASNYSVDNTVFQSILKPNAYIVTQGPMENTVTEFWRMVWQEQASCIVMLTKTFDFIKVKSHLK